MDLLLDLADAPGGSLRRRAEHALREAIRSGRLPPGTRLPATRALATQLGVSRGVLVDAYAQLAAEGYVETRRGGGTSVTRAATTNGAPHRHAELAPPPAPRHDLRPGLAALDGFPRAAWLAALGRVVRGIPTERLAHIEPGGAHELRATLAAYLGRVRGVRTEPERIVITSGMRQGIDRLWSALVANGARRVALERPGWRGWTETAAYAGLDVVPIAVDRRGVDVEAIAAADVEVAGVTPAHHYPTGAVLSASRRTALTAWARSTGGLLVEDDYDAEFRYDRRPIGSLQGLAPESVVYGGSTSKTLVHVLRIGWLALPEHLVDPFVALQDQRGAPPPLLDQLAFADLIERGELDRHLRRMRRRNRRRRDALLEAVAAKLPEARVEGAAAGLYAVLRLPDGVDEAAVLREAERRGVAVEGLGESGPAFVAGYANLPESAAPAAVQALVDAVNASA